MLLEPLKTSAFEVNMFAQHTFAHRLPMVYSSTGGSSRLQTEGPKPANADVIQAHQAYIEKVRFRKGANRILGPLGLNLARLAPLDPPVYSSHNSNLINLYSMKLSKLQCTQSA